MTIIAVIALAGNLFSIIFLSKDAKRSLNIKSAFLHLLGDTFSSVGVLITALVLIFFPKLYYLDSIASIVIALFILKEGISIFIESINILMQGMPKGIDAEKIKKRLLEDKILRIKEIHHMHIWGLSPENIILDCHIVLSKEDLHGINKKLEEINTILECDFNINHSTIQFEMEGYDHAVKCDLH